jgi:hypothetical protein
MRAAFYVPERLTGLVTAIREQHAKSRGAGDHVFLRATSVMGGPC